MDSSTSSSSSPAPSLPPTSTTSKYERYRDSNKRYAESERGKQKTAECSQRRNLEGRLKRAVQKGERLLLKAQEEGLEAAAEELVIGLAERKKELEEFLCQKGHREAPKHIGRRTPRTPAEKREVDLQKKAEALERKRERDRVYGVRKRIEKMAARFNSAEARDKIRYGQPGKRGGRKSKQADADVQESSVSPVTLVEGGISSASTDETVFEATPELAGHLLAETLSAQQVTDTMDVGVEQQLTAATLASIQF